MGRGTSYPAERILEQITGSIIIPGGAATSAGHLMELIRFINYNLPDDNLDVAKKNDINRACMQYIKYTRKHGKNTRS
jgi:hypothetical protein